MTLKKQVLISFGFLILLALANATISTLLQNRTTAAVHKIESEVLVIDKKVADLFQLIEEMRFSTAQVQQWFTDISATRGLDGLNDGIDEARAYGDAFRADAKKALDLAKELGDDGTVKAINDAIRAFDPYQQMGETMARAYIDGGPEAGNKIMGNFDAIAEEIGNAVTAMRDNVKAL